MILARYLLTLTSPEVPAEEGSADRWARMDARVLADLPAILEATEEDLNDLLKDGYEIRLEPVTLDQSTGTT